MNISQRELFSVIIKNRGIFNDVSEEFYDFIKSLPSSCAACYYRRRERELRKLVNKYREQLEFRCSMIFLKDIKIGE